MKIKNIFLTIIFSSFVFNFALPTISSAESHVYSGIAGVSAGTIVGCVLWSKLQRMQKKLDELNSLEKRSFLENLNPQDLLILEFLQRNKSDFFTTFLGGQDKELKRFLLTLSASALSAIGVYFLTHYFLNGYTFDAQLEKVDGDIRSLLRSGESFSRREKDIKGNRLFAELERLRRWELDTGRESGKLESSIGFLNDAFLTWPELSQYVQQQNQQPAQSNQPNSYPDLNDIPKQPVHQEPVFNPTSQVPRYTFQPLQRISIRRQRSSWDTVFDSLHLIDLILNLINSAKQK